MTSQIKTEWTIRAGAGTAPLCDWNVIEPGDKVAAIVLCRGDGAAAEATARRLAASADMLEALMLMKRVIDEALPKFNWGASALDAHAITLLNQAPMVIDAAIAKAEGRS